MSQSITTSNENPRDFVALVGGDVASRAAICHTSLGSKIHVEPIGDVCDLTLRDLYRARFLLAWNESGIVEQLKRQLVTMGRWAPIIAVSQRPSSQEVVTAMAAGAIDYIEWSGDIGVLERSVALANGMVGKLRPIRERQFRARHLVSKLTPRERQILLALPEGKNNKQIGRDLGISHRTVETHRLNFMRKLEVSHSAEAVRLAIETSSSPHLFDRDDRNLS